MSNKAQQVIDNLLRTATKKQQAGRRKSRTRYRPAIVSYVDILGFKNIVEKQSPPEILTILGTVRDQLRPDDVEAKEFKTRMLRFSDLIIRINPVPADAISPHDALVYWEVLALGFSQINLIWRGIIIRGALTLGDIYHATGTIFGPGLVEAHEMELAAKHPRIIIDPGLLRLTDKLPFRSRDNTPTQERKAIQDMLSVDTDGQTYIDYFKVMQDNQDDPLQLIEFLRRHAALTRKGLAENTKNHRVKRKYLWLKRKHNQYVRSLSRAALHTLGFKKRDLTV